MQNMQMEFLPDVRTDLRMMRRTACGGKWIPHGAPKPVFRDRKEGQT